MRSHWPGCLLALLLAWGLVSSPARAEEILTVDGASISAVGITIADRQIIIPIAEGMPAKQISIDDLVEFSQTINREMGELQTRYVRVEHLSPTPTNLSLAEVLVFEGDKNVAREGKATQIGTDYNGTPEKAIDGNTNGDLNAGQSVTHSSYVALPWWEVDLQRNVKVKQIELWNRTDDNLGKRLAGSRIILLDADRKPLWVHSLDNPGKQTVLKIPSTGVLFSKADIQQFQRYSGVTSSTPQSMNDKESELELVGGGKFYGTITAWIPDTISVETRFGDQTRTLTLPPVVLREIWSQEVITGKLMLPRTGEQAEFDNVYAKSESGEIQRVAGKILGRDGDSLQIEIDGKSRQLKWAKVAGLVFKLLPPATNDSPYQIVDFVSGQHLSGQVTNLSADSLQMETIWKQQIELLRSQVARISVKNGRMRSLVELTPSHAEQVGYLDLVRPYQTNKSFTGSPLQIGDEKYAEGLCTHSHTVLDYDLGGGFSQFRSAVGLQKEDGDQGHVIVRVRVDGVAKFEESLVGGQPAKAISIDLTGAKTLQLEVDFGDGFDVADHLVWGTPVLLKAAK